MTHLPPRLQAQKALSRPIKYSYWFLRCRDSWLTYREAPARRATLRARDKFTHLEILTEKRERKGKMVHGAVKKWGLRRESRLSTDWRARPSACDHPRSASYYRILSGCTHLPAFRYIPTYISASTHGCRIHARKSTHQFAGPAFRFDHPWNSAALQIQQVSHNFPSSVFINFNYKIIFY